MIFEDWMILHNERGVWGIGEKCWYTSQTPERSNTTTYVDNDTMYHQSNPAIPYSLAQRNPGGMKIREGCIESDVESRQGFASVSFAELFDRLSVETYDTTEGRSNNHNPTMMEFHRDGFVPFRFEELWRRALFTYTS